MLWQISLLSLWHKQHPIFVKTWIFGLLLIWLLYILCTEKRTGIKPSENKVTDQPGGFIWWLLKSWRCSEDKHTWSCVGDVTFSIRTHSIYLHVSTLQPTNINITDAMLSRFFKELLLLHPITPDLQLWGCWLNCSWCFVSMFPKKKCCQAPISIFSPFLILVCHCHNSQYFDISCVCFISKLLIEFPNLFEHIDLRFDEPGKNLTNLNSLCFLFYIQHLKTVNEFLFCDF